MPSITYVLGVYDYFYRVSHLTISGSALKFFRKSGFDTLRVILCVGAQCSLDHSGLLQVNTILIYLCYTVELMRFCSYTGNIIVKVSYDKERLYDDLRYYNTGVPSILCPARLGI